MAIEFNVSADPADLQRVIDQIKEAGITDVVINVTNRARLPEVTMVCAVPHRRLQQIAQILTVVIDKNKRGLSKKELIDLMCQDDPSLKEGSASVYISNASGAGFLEKTIHGYILSDEAKKEMGDE